VRTQAGSEPSAEILLPYSAEAMPTPEG